MTHPGLTILPGPLLADRTTLGVGGQAVAEIQVMGPDAVSEAMHTARSLGGRPVVLGAGSNILAGPGHLDVVLIRLAGSREPNIVREDADHVLVHAESTVKLPLLLSRLAAWGLSGLEGLAGVPGEVGGAVAMNAGSFGDEMGSVLQSVQVFTEDNGIRDYGREELEIGYRHFALPGHGGVFLVLGVTFCLRRDTPEAVSGRMRTNLAAKRANQPVGERSAGCVFKNPSPQKPAGMLLDTAGCKGLHIGAMTISDKHANFMVNRGGGSADEALELMDLVTGKVRETHGIDLEPEVVIWL